MQKKNSHHWQAADLWFSIFTLALLVFFTYGIFIRAPYIGLYFHPTDGRILQIFIPSASSLHLGDILTKVGDISWQDYKENRRQGLFNDVKNGETIDIVVNRNGEEMTIPWKIPGFNQAEFSGRFFNIWWLAYIFWFLGFTTQIFVRPKDTRWRLLVASNYLTAFWIIVGTLSGRHLWESSIFLHAATWGLLPIYLHFHWLFPKSLALLPRPVIGIFYTSSILLIIGELIQILPKTLYVLGLLITLVGIVILQVIRFIKHREQRRLVAIVALATFLAILPSTALSVSGISGIIPETSPLGLFTLPFMPLTYLFIIYRRQLGGLEMRANRFISLYSFLIILSTLLIIIFTPVLFLQIPGNIALLLGLGTTILVAFLSIQTFPAFQSFVEKRFLGIALPYQYIQEIYSNRITTSTSIADLGKLLNDEVFPSLLIQQFAFMRVQNGNLEELLAKNIDSKQLPHEIDMNELISKSGKYLPNIFPTNDWVRLILPLKIGNSPIGFWLLGRRDPDDIYHQEEIPIMQSIANQTAIALSNLLYAEQLRKIYRADTERYEQERTHLALELHDSILNELAILRTNLDETNLSDKIQTSYKEITHRLRDIVSNLRPPLLTYGLKPAIEEYVGNLKGRNVGNVQIRADLESDRESVPEKMRLHLYRIVQEACENSLRYANPRHIIIYGLLIASKVDLNIQDDGEGFETDTKLELNSLLANRHFGLAGMVQRAHLIDAIFKIHSSPNSGTRIQIIWEDNSNSTLREAEEEQA